MEQGRLLVILRPLDRHGKFSAEFEGEIIVETSTQPMIESARVLSARGYNPSALLVARHFGSEHDAMLGAVGNIVRWASPKGEEGSDVASAT